MMATTAALTLPVRRLAFARTDGGHRPDAALEWLVTNGLGGYASGPVPGALTRRFHGTLIAALPAPLGRMLYLTHLRVNLLAAARTWTLDHERLDALGDASVLPLVEFRLEAGLPVWRYEVDGIVVEKRVVMPHRRNTTHVIFSAERAPADARLRITPLLQVRPHEGALAVTLPSAPAIEVTETTVDLTFAGGLPPVRWVMTGARPEFHLDAPASMPVEYAVERARGYDFSGSIWTPGSIEVSLPAAASVSFAASTEPRTRIDEDVDAMRATEVARREALVVAADTTGDPFVAELALAADQFLITPVGRLQEVVKGREAGEEPRTIIAGYHWFTDWGRDTMISLEGLTLETGRGAEAGVILHTFAHHVRDGLIPNMFPEGEHQGLYHTADATLWFFHALDRYVARTTDEGMIGDLLPILVDIIDHHVRGTRFGIRMDPSDGLMTQGADHYQLTWMDAKVGDWVVTPRRGKAVEINALWYNALCLLARWLADAGRETDAASLQAMAERVHASFNARFWSEHAGHLYDVIDGERGDDPACRPNQLFAISLPHPVLDPSRWPAVLDVVERTLFTPVGLRSLAPGHPDYRPQYFGDLHARDAAYHQGTVWGWLIGPFVDAWLKLHPGEFTRAREFLKGFLPHLNEACVGSVSEVFDAESPFTPRGCIAQAWSVAELLRVWRKTGEGGTG